MPLPPPTVSVVIPAYNRGHVLARSVASVLQQTYSSLEVLVVDDGSTDGTPQAVANLASSDSRVRYFSHPRNQGAQAARNTGILHARGEWIAFNDSDDEWMPRKLEKQIRLLETHGYDPLISIYTNGLCVNHQSRDLTSLDLPDVTGEEGYRKILSRNGPLFQGLLVSKTALEQIGYLDEKVPAHQEWDTTIRLARVCKFACVPEPLFTYHVLSGPSISESLLRDIEGYAYIIQKFRGQIVEVLGEQGWENHHYTIVSRCLNFGLWTEARRYVRLLRPRAALRYWFYRTCCHLKIRPSRLLKHMKGTRHE